MNFNVKGIGILITVLLWIICHFIKWASDTKEEKEKYDLRATIFLAASLVELTIVSFIRG